MLGNLLVAGVVGVLVPTTLRLVRADPALGSGIVVTAVTDIMGFFFFLGNGGAADLADRLIGQIAGLGSREARAEG